MTPQELYRTFPECSHASKVAEYFTHQKGKTRGDARASSKTVFLCFTNRCGSTWIGALLSKAGVFPDKTESGLNFEFFNADSIIHTSKQEELSSLPHYVDYLIDNFVSPSGYLSTKISVDQLAWLSHTGIIKSQLRNPHFIYVRRRNTLAQAISFSIAMQTHQWTSNHPETGAVAEYRPIDILRLHRIIITANAQFQAFFSAHGITPLEIIYEDVLDQDTIVLEWVGTELGLELALGDAPRQKSKKGFNVVRQRTSMNKEWEEKLRNKFRDVLGLS